MILQQRFSITVNCCVPIVIFFVLVLFLQCDSTWLTQLPRDALPSCGSGFVILILISFIISTVLCVVIETGAPQWNLIWKTVSFKSWWHILMNVLNSLKKTVQFY